MTPKKTLTKLNFHFLFAISLVLSVYASMALALETEDQQLLEIKMLEEGGASGLALRIMDRLQPELKQEQSRWLVWERQRLEIYAAIQGWATLITRVEQLPKPLPDEYRRWAMTQQALAHHELKQGQQARLIIRRLLISSANQLDEETLGWLQRWRRFIIQSYLADGLVHDAYTAIVRFQQDYPVQTDELLLLRARVLLMSKRPVQAIELLEKYRTKAEANMLYLLAQLRSQQQTPADVIKAGLQQIGEKKLDKTVRMTLWGVVAEAAQQAGDHNNSVKALEYVLSTGDGLSPTSLFDFNADTLWQAYIDYALMLGNKAQLLIGEDEKWLLEAEKHHKKNSRMARAYYALLIRRGASVDSRQHATEQFVKLLKRKREGERLIVALFTKSQYYATNTDIPEAVRHEIVDIALAQQNIPQASEIMSTLNEPPKGNTSYMWHLRRARILVLGGQTRKGAEVLKTFLHDNPEVDKTQIDRLLQVVFDLQTVKEHDAAYELFQQIIDLNPDINMQRELYYWMAESRKAQTRYDEAAQLYLKSAFLRDKGLDPWGQTARYQAAEALGKAGLVDDAFTMFQQLLRTTKEVDRRAVLHHEIEKLKLSRKDSDEGRVTRDEAQK